MKLKDWLKDKKLPIVRFANNIRYGQFYIGKVASGKIKPGYKLIKIIEEATQGLVKEEDWI